MIAIDTENFRATQHHLLVALISLAMVGVVMAALLGFWVARIGLKPLEKLSDEAQTRPAQTLRGACNCHRCRRS